MQLRLPFAMLIPIVLCNQSSKFQGSERMKNLYLITGEEEYEKWEALATIKKSFPVLQKGVNDIVLEKEQIDLLKQELTTYSFFQEPKLVLVKVPKKAGDEEETTSRKEWFTPELEECIQNKIETITLVFWEEGTSKGKLNKFITKEGTVILCEKHKPKELIPWIQEYGKTIGIAIGKEEAAYLIELCGSQKQVLVNEIAKLRDYVENQTITKEDIDRMTVKTSELMIFDITDCYGKREIASALRYLEELLNQKEPLQKIFIMIAKHFKSLLLAKVALEQGKSVATELGCHPFAAKKYAEQSQNFTKQELITIFKEFAKLDADSKVGKIDLKVGMQRIMMMEV